MHKNSLMPPAVAHARVRASGPQIGFNAGHSATVWLEGLNTSLRSFDIFRLPFSSACRDHIAERYPGRVQYFKGYSHVTVPQYGAEVEAGRAAPCDVWFIDGECVARNRAAANSRRRPNALADPTRRACSSLTATSTLRPRI